MCDHCVVLLLDDLERAGALLPAIREQLHSINTSSTAWARLFRLNTSIADLQVLHGPGARPPPPGLQALTIFSPQSQLRSPLGPRHKTAQQLEALEGQSRSLGQDAQQLDRQAGPRGLRPSPPEPRPRPLSCCSPRAQTICCHP